MSQISVPLDALPRPGRKHPCPCCAFQWVEGLTRPGGHSPDFVCRIVSPHPDGVNNLRLWWQGTVHILPFVCSVWVHPCAYGVRIERKLAMHTLAAVLLLLAARVLQLVRER